MNIGDRVRWGRLSGVVEELALMDDGRPGCWVDWQTDAGSPIPHERKQTLGAGFACQDLEDKAQTAVETLREGQTR